MTKKLKVFCDRCACAVQDWHCVPSKHNVRFYDLTVQCHGEVERYRIPVNDLIHDRNPRPWYIIAFEDEEPKTYVKYIELPGKCLSIMIRNRTNRLVEDG
jgi:hypothetical protein